jgi:hypothetical protein
MKRIIAALAASGLAIGFAAVAAPVVASATPATTAVTYETGVGQFKGETTQALADVVPPITCVLSGASDTEAGDLPPVQSEDGLVFDGPTAVGQAKDIYYRVSSGNAQGITGIGYTVAPGAVGHTATINIEVNPNADLGSGVIHYATLAAFVTGSGVYTNLEVQPIWWTTKIAYAQPGGAGHPLTYAALVALMPNNTLFSAPSLHLQSSSPSSAHSVVTSLTSSCGSFNYVNSGTPVTPPTSVKTGDGSPLAPWYPVMAFGTLGVLLSTAAARRKFASK